MSNLEATPGVLPGLPARAVRWLLITLVASLALAGCTSLLGKREPPLRTFLLEASLPPAPCAQPAQPRHRNARSSLPILVVNLPQARPGFDTPRMAYIRRPYALDFFSYHQWTDSPARLLLPLLVKAMESSGCWQAVFTTVPENAGYRLEIDELMLAQEFLSSPSRVRLALRARLDAVESGQPVAERRFELQEPAAEDTPYEGVVAANRAVGDLLEVLVQWTRQVRNCQPETTNGPAQSFLSLPALISDQTLEGATIPGRARGARVQEQKGSRDRGLLPGWGPHLVGLEGTGSPLQRRTNHPAE